MASAAVGSGIRLCYFSTGTCLLTMVERKPCRRDGEGGGCSSYTPTGAPGDQSRRHRGTLAPEYRKSDAIASLFELPAVKRKATAVGAK